VSEEAVVVANAIGEAGAFAIEQAEVGVKTGGVDEDDAGIVFGDLFGLSVYDADACGFVLFFVVDDLAYHAIRLEGEVTGTFGPGDRRRVRVEITAEGTAPFAHIAGLALAAALLDVDGFGFCEVGATADDDGTIGIALHDLFPDMFFDAVHFPGRKEFAVG
jgi:hypothetical protein